MGVHIVSLGPWLHFRTFLRNASAGNPSVVRAKLAKGYTVPWHWRTPNVPVLTARGTAELKVQDKDGPAHPRPDDLAYMLTHHPAGFLSDFLPRPGAGLWGDSMAYQAAPHSSYNAEFFLAEFFP